MISKKLDIFRADLQAHQLVGKELVPPFERMGMPTKQIMWARDFLPEFLWIDSLVQAHGEWGAIQVFNEFLSAADRFNTREAEILDGTVSAFKLIPEAERRECLAQLGKEVRIATLGPLENVLSLYRDCPMSWLVTKSPAATDSSVERVRGAVVRLLPGKDEYAAFCRTLPLHRMMAHNRVCIASHLKHLIEAIRTYPQGDKFRVESFARQAHTLDLMHRAEKDPTLFSWAQSFWTSNFKLAGCRYE